MLDKEKEEGIKNNPASGIQPATDVLKEENIFLIALNDGSIVNQDHSTLGLYYNDTRYLSQMELKVCGLKPVFLSSSVRHSHFDQIELANYFFKAANGRLIPSQSIHLRLLRIIKDALWQRMRLLNFNSFAVDLTLSFSLAADFKDIFEIRGAKRTNRGEFLPARKDKRGVTFTYHGIDGITRLTKVIFEPRPTKITLTEEKAEVIFNLKLPPQKKTYLFTKIIPAEEQETDSTSLKKFFFNKSVEQEKAYMEWQQKTTEIYTDNEFINEAFQRAVTDLKSLTINFDETGRTIAAGIPWYTAPFGRDSLITCWQSLIVNPEITKDNLRFLAHYQGKEINSWSEERPGKILHELRRDEMSRAGVLPYNPYYGSVDSTLWFIILLGAYYRWCEDQEFLEEMATALESCLSWCFNYGDLDGDGYIEYQKESPLGLDNQGWKDSWDAVVDKEANLVSSPIALVEVQAYYYLALLEAARLLKALGRKEEAEQLTQKAKELKIRFNQDFWLKEEDYLIFALDGAKKPVTTIVSNGGQVLFSGILSAQRAQKVAKRLFEEDLYSGWGIRTMSKAEKAYNPMSYHNGSVWPHDNAIIAAGLRRYQFLEELSKLANGLFAALPHFTYRRWAELFCGFTKRGLSGPVKYPVACDPQAWAVGSFFSFIHSLLGLQFQANKLIISKPLLIPGTHMAEIRNLKVGKGKIDLFFEEKDKKVVVYVTEKEGDFKVVLDL